MVRNISVLLASGIITIDHGQSSLELRGLVFLGGVKTALGPHRDRLPMPRDARVRVRPITYVRPWYTCVRKHCLGEFCAGRNSSGCMWWGGSTICLPFDFNGLIVINTFILSWVCLVSFSFFYHLFIFRFLFFSFRRSPRLAFFFLHNNNNSSECNKNIYANLLLCIIVVLLFIITTHNIQLKYKVIIISTLTTIIYIQYSVSIY